MASDNTLKQGRQAFRQQAWADAYTFLSAADEETVLDADDLESLAKAAYLIGKESKCTKIWARVHQKFLEQNNTERAACSAFWLGMVLFNRGEHAQGSGWIARAKRLIKDYKQKCAEQGLLLIPRGLQQLRQGDGEAAYNLFNQAAKIGTRFKNKDLQTLGRLGCGQALIQQKRIEEGTTLLDEAMVGVVSDELSPIVAGIVYCAIIETCQKIYDLQRAQEWTDALSRWCDAQPDLIPYRGQCLVRRAEILQLRGRWPDAMEEVQRACELTQTSSPPATGEAFYRQAELYRLQGHYSKAEKAYRQSSKWGRSPQPGLALLRLAQGDIDSAKTAIQHVEDEIQERMPRSRILPAYVEIMLASQELQTAKAKASELSDIATELGAPYLKAIAARSQGSVLLANSKPGTALKKMRQSWSLLKQVEASYESARTQVLIGLACRNLGDEDTATMEFHAAREIFEQLGATPDLSNVNSLIKKKRPENTHGLTPRELEVLCILATGKTNKDIAKELYISERTVDRHVSNILGKLNVETRAAATAYAYEHNMV
ncbi:LuxR C-terminal-related transcriptional regulator [Halalkalibaculum sp. DA384]|uniref:LuxR C-terminal-related transcriptional regulator n=1 Tax=Halalkalibaculum sp. DA384 TaxID=3373606 RepID=UPI0037542E27